MKMDKFRFTFIYCLVLGQSFGDLLIFYLVLKKPLLFLWIIFLYLSVRITFTTVLVKDMVLKKQQSSPFKECRSFHRGERSIFEGFFVILWHYLPSEIFSPSFEIKGTRPSFCSCNLKVPYRNFVISQVFILNIMLFVLFLHNVLILSFHCKGTKFLSRYRKNLENVSSWGLKKSKDKLKYTIQVMLKIHF